MAGEQDMTDADRQALADLTREAERGRAYLALIESSDPVDERLAERTRSRWA